MHKDLCSGDYKSTKVGFTNEKNQTCHGTLGVEGTDHQSYAYRLECLCCGFVYGANGGDIWERQCPECQGGAPGIRYWLK